MEDPMNNDVFIAFRNLKKKLMLMAASSVYGISQKEDELNWHSHNTQLFLFFKRIVERYKEDFDERGFLLDVRGLFIVAGGGLVATLEDYSKGTVHPDLERLTKEFDNWVLEQTDSPDLKRIIPSFLKN